MKSNVVVTPMLTEWRKKRMLKQQYGVVGNHSAVKICHWCKSKIRGKRSCYKLDFYGIPSEKCLEMSPAITCNQRCTHCWRDTSVFSGKWEGPVDDPNDIIDGCLHERTLLLNGFKGQDHITEEIFQDITTPTHAAISLTGEPCMYPRLPELIDAFYDRGFKTVFLVTSGTVPARLRELNTLPTNLYLSLEATNEEQYKALCIPVLEHSWEKVRESMDVLRNMETRTVLRITLMKGLNMDDPAAFIPLIERMQPDVIETKGYAWMGYSQQRLRPENQPTFAEVQAFADALMELAPYKKGGEVEPSTIVMMQRDPPRSSSQSAQFLLSKS